MAKLVPIKLTVNGSEARREIRAVGKELRNLNNLTIRQAGASQNLIFSRQQIAEIQRISRIRQQHDLINSRHQNKMAEISARHTAKMAEQGARARISAESNANRAIEAQRRRDYQDYVRNERQKTAAMQEEIKNQMAAFDGAGGNEDLGGKISSIGSTLTFGATAPIAAATYVLGNYGLEIEELKNQLTAFEGTAIKAENRLDRLRQVSDGATGATREMTYSVYGLLKPLETVSDETIETTIEALGRLKLGFKDLVPSDFAYNLTQIFGQNFEEQDIKQALGQVPKFRQYLKQAFGTEDKDSLQAMKASGKLTMDSFFQGIAEAVQNDQALAGLQEPVRLRMQKTFERLFEAVEPLANILVNVIAKAIEYATPLIAKLAEIFKTLSPAVQYAVVAFVGIVAAIGPVLVVLGGAVSFISSVIGGIQTIAGALAGVALGPILLKIAVIAGIVAAALAALGTAVYVLYKAWQTNFGGIRDYTIATWERVKSIVGTAMTALFKFVQQIGGQIVAWWNENYPLIESVVGQVSAKIRFYTETAVNLINSLWDDHGSRVMQYVSTAWDSIKNIVSNTVTYIGSFIKLGLQVLNGDWQGAWDSVLDITRNTFKFLVQFGKELIGVLFKYFEMIGPMIAQYGSFWITSGKGKITELVSGIVSILATLPEKIVELAPKLYRAGLDIGKAIIEGVIEGLKPRMSLSDSASVGLNLGANPFEDSFGVKGTNFFDSQKTLEKISDSDNKKGIKKKEFEMSSEARALVDAANRLGINPLDLAMIISFETGGSFNPNKVGGEGNKYRGLIQFGPSEQKQFGVYKGQSFEDQIKTSVVDYFTTRFAGVGRTTRGASLLDLYTTVIAGNPNANPDAKDANGVSARIGMQKMLREHRGSALKRFFGGSLENFTKNQGDISLSNSEISDSLTKAAREQNLRKAMEFYRRAGLIPSDELLNSFQSLMAEEARKAGVVQPTKGDVRAVFVAEAEKRRTEVDLPQDMPTIQRTVIAMRKTADQEHIDALRETLGIENDAYQLAIRQRNMAAEIAEFGVSARLKQSLELLDVELDIEVLRRQNADAAFVTERRTLAAKREQFALEQEIAGLQDQIANAGVNDALIIQAEYLKTVLDLRQRELNAVIAINRAELEISQSMELSNNQIRARVLEHLAGQQTLNESIADGIIQTYEVIAARAGSALDKLNEKTKGVLSFLIEPAKALQRSFLTKITRNLLDQFLPGMGEELTKTNNPIARPIVDEVGKTNKILERIEKKMLTGGASASVGGFGGIFGGGGLGGINGGAIPTTGNRALASGGLGALSGNSLGTYGTRTGDIVNGVSQVFSGDRGRGDVWSNVKHLFSTKDGGIFAKRKTIFGKESRMGGIMGGIGDLASFAGGLIGGRGGNILSMAGTGMSIGSMFGPWGAAIGAGVGALIGLFGGDPKRKRDKREKLPQLNQSFTDAFKEFTELIADVSALRTDPDSALAKGRELRQAIASGFGIQFESKKYRRESQKMIADKLSAIDKMPDGLMEQLKRAVERAQAAGERARRILPEFASGVYMSGAFASQYGDFKRRNGMLQGAFTGRDTLPSMLARGEMVLNPDQIARVKAVAGFDPFSYAKIPGYANGGFIAPSVPTPNISVGAPQINLNLTLVERDDGGFDAYLDSEKGERKIEVVVNKLKKNKEFKRK